MQNGERVEIIEVSPRDGIQNEKKILATDVKRALIERAIDAGVGRLEATSFVNPKRVPQMADADDLMASLPKGKARYIGLALNRRGFERAVAAGVDEVNFVVVATETFNQRNQGVPVDETLAQWRDVASLARDAGVPVGMTIGASFGCPFEGEVPEARVADLAARIAEEGPSEIALADTIGVAAPSDIGARIDAVRSAIGDIPLRCHFHNTRNTGLANAVAAVEAGLRRFDSSIGGVGGCPFAPAATGNIPTEDLVYMLHRMGIDTGLDLDKLIDTAVWLEEQLEITAPGMVHRAGAFPSKSAA
jgi:hydroxymethylglutaryl-CoA lyase